MGSRITEVVIDCIAPERAATFWGAALGWEMHRDGDDYWMSESGRDDAGDLVLIFEAVPEPKAVKNRVHLDLSPKGVSQQEELERLLSLGAVPVDVNQGEVSWIVLADPEGNEFCLLSRTRE